MLNPAMILKLVSGLMAGPFGKLLEAHFKDAELRRRLEGELQTALVGELGKLRGLEQEIVLAEIKSDSWLTRSWRPILMLSLLGFLGFVGLILPLFDMMLGTTLPFNPRWQALPQGFWDFLSVGVGGYIGGRSLEKIAGQVALPQQKSISARPSR